MLGQSNQDRGFVVGNGDQEGLAVLQIGVIFRGVGHLSGAHREESAILMARDKFDHFTVIPCHRLSPADQCATVTFVIGRGDVGGHVVDLRGVHVVNGHLERLIGYVTVDIGHRVNDGRDSHRELVTRGMGGFDAFHSTVVCGTRLRPGEVCATKTQQVVGGKINGQTGKLRRLTVDHGHSEGLKGDVAVNILSRVDHFRGSDGVNSRDIVGDEGRNSAVVGSLWLFPLDESVTATLISLDDDISGHSGDQGRGVVDNGDGESGLYKVGVSVIHGQADEGRSNGEDVSRLEAGGQRRCTAVVGKSRLFPNVGSTTEILIIVEDHICRNIGDGRQFVIQNGQLEGGLRNVSGCVGDGVGHQGDTHRECGTGLIIHLDGDIVTVVGEGRCRPADCCGTEPGVTVHKDGSGQSVDRRKIVVRNSDVEGMGRLVAIHIGCGVGHRGRSHRERIGGGMVAGKISDSTVVCGARLIPAHHSLTRAGIVRDRDVRGAVGNGRQLIIGDGHRKGGRVHVAAHIGGRVGHQSVAHREGISGGVTADDRIDATIIRDSRLRPSCRCFAASLESTDGKVTTQAFEGRQLGINIHFANVGDIVFITVQSTIGNITGVRDTVSFTVLLDSRKNIAGVGNVVAVTVRLTAILQLALVGNQVIVTIR